MNVHSLCADRERHVKGDASLFAERIGGLSSIELPASTVREALQQLRARGP
jgi:hypothetical protein